MKKYIIGFILGAIIFGGIGVGATVLYNSSEIGFTPTNSNWHVNNMQDAINDLYANSDSKPVLLWTNPSPASSFAAQTISLDLSEYKYVIIVTYTDTESDYIPRSSTIVPVGGENPINLAITNDRAGRYATATTSGIEFTAGFYGTTNNQNRFAIPYKIYGVKQNLGLDLGLDN